MRNMKNVQNKYIIIWKKIERCETTTRERRIAVGNHRHTHTHTQIDDSRRNKENDKFSFNRKVFVFVLCKYYVERLKPNFSSCCCAKHLNGFVVFSSIFWQRDLERESAAKLLSFVTVFFASSKNRPTISFCSNLFSHL